MSGGYLRYTAPTVTDLDVVTRDTLQPAMKAAERLDSTDRVRSYRTAHDATGGSITTTVADVPGCVQTIKIRGAAAFVIVYGTFDFSGFPSAFWAIRGQLWVNGVVKTGDAVKYIGKIDRTTTTRVWPFVLACGTHELKLRMVKDAGAGTATLNATAHTGITTTVVDIP
jgi:hypothetical protein